MPHESFGGSVKDLGYSALFRNVFLPNGTLTLCHSSLSDSNDASIIIMNDIIQRSIVVLKS